MSTVIRAYKYFVRPADVASEVKAINEVAEYSRLREAYRRLRHTVPFGPLSLEALTRAEEIRAEAALDGRRKASAEKATDRGLLKLEAARAIYAGRRCCYTTARLAQQAGEKAKHSLKAWDMLEGRAGMLPERVSWDGNALHYSGTTWTIHRRQLEKRPLDPAAIGLMYLARRRWTPCAVTKQKYRWYLIVTVEVEQEVRSVYPYRCAAGFDLAWRRSPDRPVLRVGYVATERGEHFEVRTDERALQRKAHAESVEAIADREVGDPLRAELGMHPRSSDGKTIYRAGERDSRAVQLAHLVRWAHGQKRNAIAARNEHHVLTIHELCRRYHTIYVEDMKGEPQLVARHKTVRRVKPDAEQGAAARDQRHSIAAFTFLRRLEQEAPKYGTQVVGVEPAHTSRECMCGHNMGDPRAERERRCAACGRSWDVDYLAALNLLRRGGARVSGSEAAE